MWKQNTSKKFDSTQMAVKYFSDSHSYGVVNTITNQWYGLFWSRLDAYNYIEEFGY